MQPHEDCEAGDAWGWDNNVRYVMKRQLAEKCRRSKRFSKMT